MPLSAKKNFLGLTSFCLLTLPNIVSFLSRLENKFSKQSCFVSLKLKRSISVTSKAARLVVYMVVLAWFSDYFSAFFLNLIQE